jgi:hypothetical protein
MTVRPFEEYKENRAAQHRQIDAALAENNLSAAMGAFQALAIATGVMLHNYAGLFEQEQRRAICRELADAALAVAAPRTSDDDQDKNPMKFEREMFDDGTRLAGQIALEHGYPEIQKALSGKQAQSHAFAKPPVPAL